MAVMCISSITLHITFSGDDAFTCHCQLPYLHEGLHVFSGVSDTSEQRFSVTWEDDAINQIVAVAKRKEKAISN